jgi:hypothetical protein
MYNRSWISICSVSIFFFYKIESSPKSWTLALKAFSISSTKCVDTGSSRSSIKGQMTCSQGVAYKSSSAILNTAPTTSSNM